MGNTFALYVERGTNLLMKIKNSLSSRIFIGMFLALMSTFVIGFLVIKWITPNLYAHKFRIDFESMVISLVNDITGVVQEELDTFIFEFAYEHRADVLLKKGELEIRARFHDWEVASRNELLQFDFTNVNSDTGEIFFLEVTSSTIPITLAMSTIFDVWYWLLLAGLFVSFFVSYCCARFLAHPIIEISKMSGKIKDLNLKERVNISRADEIGVLANNLNLMAAILDETLIDLENTNRSMKKKIAYEKTLEKQKNDFLMALSHELKTPLTVLMTYLEGMIEDIGDFKNKVCYLREAQKTVLSMDELVKQLLAITALQSVEVVDAKEMTDVGQLVEDVCRCYEGLADVHGVLLTVYCEKEVVVLMNSVQLKTVVSNILSNAITNTNRDGLVDIQFERMEGRSLLSVKNYGATILEEDLLHLFNLFYRVDKSRNKRTGGTGLGLYIVKCILELHGFSYGIESDDEGVVFWIDFAEG